MAKIEAKDRANVTRKNDATLGNLDAIQGRVHVGPQRKDSDKADKFNNYRKDNVATNSLNDKLHTFKGRAQNEFLGPIDDIFKTGLPGLGHKDKTITSTEGYTKKLGQGHIDTEKTTTPPNAKNEDTSAFTSGRTKWEDTHNAGHEQYEKRFVHPRNGLPEAVYHSLLDGVKDRNVSPSEWDCMVIGARVGLRYMKAESS